MAATTPRIARVPHTTKAPEACPHCGGRKLTRRGTRKKQLEIVQLWRCASCKRVFTPSPAALRNKTYPLRMVLQALTDYNLGYSLKETAARLKKKTGRNISPSTVATWLHEYQQHCAYRRIRSKARSRFMPAQTIRSIKLYHRQVYAFAYHRPKLELLKAGTLDDKRKGDARFAGVADFLESVPTICPHGLFCREDGARGSQLASAFIDTARLVVSTKQNAATDTAALIIPSVGNNKLRHETLQRFMLANDSTTLAVEVPIWLTERDIVEIERLYGIRLREQGTTSITGHIDFLQVRNGAVHILDYKPDARTNRPITQLTIYALALTRLIPWLRLFDIECAWFNEHEYCEFFPRTLFARPQSAANNVAR